jgi:uncharacterized surface protein with fasciclin (FAS1) repeats
MESAIFEGRDEMKKSVLLMMAVMALAASTLATEDKPQMSPAKNIMQNAAGTPELSTLVAAIKAAGLEKMLEGPGPYTLFAPKNDAFTDLPKGTWETLMKPENKEQLKKVLQFHIVAGKWTTDDLKKKIAEGKGVFDITTVEGGKLHIADHNGMHLMLRDDDDDMGMFNAWDLAQSNGVIHVIDNVMMPKP